MCHRSTRRWVSNRTSKEKPARVMRDGTCLRTDLILNLPRSPDRIPQSSVREPPEDFLVSGAAAPWDTRWLRFLGATGLAAGDCSCTCDGPADDSSSSRRFTFAPGSLVDIHFNEFCEQGRSWLGLRGQGGSLSWTYSQGLSGGTFRAASL